MIRPREPDSARWPTMFIVEWYSPERCSDGEIHPVRTFRCFAGTSHGNADLAYAAAVRFIKLMKRRDGVDAVQLTVDA